MPSHLRASFRFLADIVSRLDDVSYPSFLAADETTTCLVKKTLIFR